MNKQSGDFESLRDSSVLGIPGAPHIPLANSVLWRLIGQALPDCGHGGGGVLRGVRVLPRGDTWPHAVEMPIRYLAALPCKLRIRIKLSVIVKPDNLEAQV